MYAILRAIESNRFKTTLKGLLPKQSEISILDKTFQSCKDDVPTLIATTLKDNTAKPE